MWKKSIQHKVESGIWFFEIRCFNGIYFEEIASPRDPLPNARHWYPFSISMMDFGEGRRIFKCRLPFVEVNISKRKYVSKLTFPKSLQTSFMKQHKSHFVERYE